MSLPCPDCAAPLPEPVGAACPACALPLRGAEAARLYEIDTALGALTAERARVLAVLRAARGGAALPAALPPVPGRAPRSPRAVLLGLGALLLLVATSVFLAVVWLLIGVVGQVAVMAGATAGAGAAAVETGRRGLASTSTTLAWLAAGLTVVAVQAGRTLGLPGLADLPVLTAVALTAALGTVAAGLAARRSGLPVFAGQAVLASGLVLPPLLAELVGQPSAVLAATGAWGLAALALAALRPGLLHPRAEGAVRGVAAVGGGLALGGAVAVGGLVAAVTPLSAAESLRCAALVAVLAVVALAGSLQRVPQALPLAAPAAGAAVLVLAHRAGGVLGDAPLAVTAVGVAGLLAAGGLLGRPQPAARWTGVAAAVAGVLALLRDLSLQDWRGVTALAGALALAAAAVAAASRDDARARTLALPLAAAAADGTVAAALAAGQARVLTLVAAVGACAVLTVFLAAWYQEEPEEPALGAVALVGLGAALSGALALPRPALACAALLAVGGVLALAYACLPRRGWVAPLGVVLSSAASWTLLADAGEDRVEAYTLPVAALLLVVGLVRRSREPQAPSWSTVGPAVAMALLPSAQVAAGDPGSVRILLALAAGAAVLLLGVRLHLRALVVTAGVVVGELALVQLGQAALYLPRWLVLATLGALLLGAGATYEARVQQARAAGRWVAALR